MRWKNSVIYILQCILCQVFMWIMKNDESNIGENKFTNDQKTITFSEIIQHWMYLFVLCIYVYINAVCVADESISRCDTVRYILWLQSSSLISLSSIFPPLRLLPSWIQTNTYNSNKHHWCMPPCVYAQYVSIEIPNHGIIKFTAISRILAIDRCWYLHLNFSLPFSSAPSLRFFFYSTGAYIILHQWSKWCIVFTFEK